MLTLTTTNILLICLTVVAVVALVSLIFRKDDAIEERRDNMLKLYAKLQELGLEHLAGVAKAYVIGDYTALYREAKELLHKVQDPDQVMQLLSKSFYAQLPRRLAGDEYNKIIAIVNAAKPGSSTPKPV